MGGVFGGGATSECRNELVAVCMCVCVCVCVYTLHVCELYLGTE